MAKKPQSDNFDALGSIYDFIFTEAKKPPDKRKPVRMKPGTPTDSMLRDALFSSLEVPGAFLTNTVIASFNDAIDIEMGRITYGEFGNLKFTSTNILDILKDPEKAFNDTIKKQKAVRNSMKATFLGGMLDDFVHSGWAHKFADIEAQKAIYGNSIAKEADRFKIQSALGQYAATHADDNRSALQQTKVSGRWLSTDINFMANRSFDLLANKIFEPSIWNGLSQAEKKEFTDMVSGGKRVEEIRDYLAQKFSSQGPRVVARITDRFNRVIAPIGKNDKEDLNVYDTKVYRFLEQDNLEDRINKSKSPEEKAMYEKTLYLLKRDRVNLSNAVNDIQTRLNAATTDEEKKKFKGELKDAKEALRIIEGHTFLGRIGQIEGYWNSLNSVYGGVLGTNVVASYLNGSLYDKNKNSLFLPVDETSVGGVKIFISKQYRDEKTGDILKDAPHTILSKYNQVLTDANYLTPRSILRTFLYNGEGFAYLLHKNIKNISVLGINEKELLDIFTGKGIKDVEISVSDILSKAQASMSPADFAKLEKLLNSSKNLQKLVNVFSMPYQLKEQIVKYFGKSIEKARNKVVGWILSNPKVREVFAKFGADVLLKQWAAKGGLTVLIKSLLTALVAALGITMTPVVSFIVGALTWVASDLVMKAIGVTINVVKYIVTAVAIVVLFIVTVGMAAVMNFNKETMSYRSEVPGDIIMCSAYEEIELEPGEEPWGDVIVPPPSGESCVLGSGSFYCSQGYVDVQGWSHQRIGHLMPVDLTNVSYIYAPQFCSTGDCSITRIARISCSDGSNAGGIVEMTASTGSTTYLFKLLHVKPLAGLGEKLSGGQPVAVVQDRPEVEAGNCWTGKHLHIETRQNGSVVDPLELLQSFGCSVPDETSCANP